MTNELKNPIVVYPIDLLEQAIFAAALQNYEHDKAVGNDPGPDMDNTYLLEARHVLTSSELDFQNYTPEDPKIPLIVMETSTLAKDRPTVKRLSDIPFGDLKIGDKVISKKIKVVNFSTLFGLIVFDVVVEDRLPGIKAAVKKYKTQVRLRVFWRKFSLIFRSSEKPFFAIDDQEVL